MENKLSKDEILQTSYIQNILEIPTIETRERILADAETRAKELKVYQNFKRLFKSVQAEMIQNQKQINSRETEFLQQPIKLKCKDYICNDMGVFKVEFDPVLMKSNEILVCSHPILPVERLINIETNIEKVKIAFYKDGRWQNVIVERNTIASKNKILQLANTGIEVTETNAKELIIYLATLISINTETIPLNKAVTHLGWVDNGFVPFIKDYKFDGDRSFESVFKDVTEKGNEELWFKTIVELRENEVLHFLISAGYASLLIEKVHINPFIVHLWGQSGTGKTVALLAVMSNFGNPAIGHLVKNLNSTNVGFERLSAFLNNIPFAGDELQSIKNRFSDFNELIYRLTQGEGKSRGTVDGGIAEQLKWNCAFFTTGEEPITTDFSKEGVKNRVIEIEENQKLVENGKDIVNILLENYGYGVQKFIDTLPTDEYLLKRHTEIFKELNEKYKNTGKQTNAIALIILADEILTQYIFEDNCLNVDNVKRFFREDIDEAERIYTKITDWIIQNINKFKEENFSEIWGKYAPSENAVYIIPKVLKDFLSENGVSFDGVKQKLAEMGYIEKDIKGKFAQVTRLSNGMCYRCIKLIIKNKDDSEEQTTMDELPF